MALPEKPAPMNVVKQHSKVNVSVTLSDPTFVAGRYVSGKMEMECRADKGLGIGVIMVELFGIQELTSRDHSATSTFLHAQRLFQSPGLPPSNAVQAHAEPGDPPLPASHYHARRGISTFLFRIPLPITCPSSVNFGGGLAAVKYEVRASASVYWRGDKRLVTERKSVDVVEGLDDMALAQYANGKGATPIVVGENGKIWMQGSVVGGGIITAGEPACVELHVKNHSPKKNSGLTVTLTRHLFLPGASSNVNKPLQISDTLTSVAFRGPEYIIHPGVEGVANLVFDIPKNARGVKGGFYEDEGEERPRETPAIFEVQCIVSVRMSMGIGSKDLILDIPVTVVHPFALPDEPTTFSSQDQPYYAAPVAPAVPYSILAPYPDHVQYNSYPVSPQSASPAPPPITSPPLFTAFTDQNRVWLPPLQLQSPLPYHYISPLDPLYPQLASPPLQVPVYQLPARPSSALANPYSHSFYPDPPAISGLPPTAAQHPLLPLDLTNNHRSSPVAKNILDHLEPEEGKGERASRVAHHLRMSSRHRSVSPRSHRFPLPQSSPRSANQTDQPPTHQRALPPAPLLIPIQEPDTTDPFSNNDGIVSPPLHFPRPMLSPKMSNSSLRSQRVEDLERMAAETENETTRESAEKRKRKKNSRKGKQKEEVNSEVDINKTLPPPPVPTRKGLLAPPSGAGVPSLNQATTTPDIMPSIPLPADKAPPTPTLTALTFTRRPRSNLNIPSGKRDEVGLESGLDALERKLLAEVGTQKVDRAFGVVRAWDVFGLSDNERIDEPQDLPSTGDTPSVGQPVKARLSPIKIPSVKTPGSAGDGSLNLDSAISSLTLADGGWAMKDREENEKEKDGERDPGERARTPAGHYTTEQEVDGDSDERTHRAGTVGGKSKSKSSYSGDDGREQRALKRAQRRQRAEGALGDSEVDEEAAARCRSREGSTKGKKGGKKKDGHHKIRKAAKGRVAAWLGTIDPHPIPPEDDLPATPYTDPLSDMQQPPLTEDMPIQELQPRTEAEGIEAAPSLPLSDVHTPPNPRSSGFMPIGSQRKDGKHVRSAGVPNDRHQITPSLSSKSMATHAPTKENNMETNVVEITQGPTVKLVAADPKEIGYHRSQRSADRDGKIPIVGSKKGGPVLAVPPNDSSPHGNHVVAHTKQQGVQPRLRLPAVSAAFRQGQDPEVKYDVRSARGGRGGIVTTVAAIWASAAANERPKANTPKHVSIDGHAKTAHVTADSSAQTKLPGVRSSAKPPATQQAINVAVKPQALRQVAGKATLVAAATAEIPPKLLDLAGGKRTRPVTKSPSVPAIISSSLATPMLSSTASLARPANTSTANKAPRHLPTPDLTSPTNPVPVPNIAVETAPRPHGPSKAKSTPDLAFGKARLRDLIKKYQEQTSS
ncbi:hypothetical protein AMATHDRAFT_85363 [Amanita thiersii Skay4041]|uniref:Arrestin-like N-terminal domain-containing protein n=1 Tax=Amanita thiersii Skay4041 TaxID=703135 RepID=A0A2A9NTL5_9AGAR|nr:hypothetical protein AMATHDRAFT_85363 [Amanita thiersii Skay4041]